MERSQVIAIVDSLANGMDPATGVRIPHDVFHTGDVVRALFSAVELLKQEPVRESGTSRPASAGARWTDEEDALLCHEFDGGTPIREIAQQHGRTAGAITSRLVRLGRIDADSVTVRDRGAHVVS